MPARRCDGLQMPLLLSHFQIKRKFLLVRVLYVDPILVLNANVFSRFRFFVKLQILTKVKTEFIIVAFYL